MFEPNSDRIKAESCQNGRQIHFLGKDWFDYTQQLWMQICYEHWDTPTGELVRPPWTITLRYTMPQDLETLLHCDISQGESTWASTSR